MQKKMFIVIGFLFIGTMFIFTQHANAIGVGGYLTYANANYDWTYEDALTDYEFDDSSSAPKFGAGFILDSCVAKDTLFNDRLNVGYSFYNMDNDKLPKLKGFDYHVYNSFGFGIVRNEMIRLWVGPQVGIGMLYGTFDDDSTDEDANFVTFYGSLGAVAGINVHLASQFSIGFDAGYRFSSHIGASDYGVDGSDVTGNGGEVFANISFIARFNDSFSSAE